MLERAFFRADSGPDIGDGHIMRCLALAQEFAREQVECLLLTRVSVGRACSAWVECGFEIRILDASSSAFDDAAITTSVANEWNASCVILDGYDFQRNMFQNLNDARLVTVRFDDTGELDFPCSLVINQNPGAEVRFHQAYTEAQSTLLGLRFTCLRDKVLSLIPTGGGGILICFGGSEPASTGFDIARAIREQNKDVPIVLVGPNAKAFESSLQGLEIYEPTDLIPLFKNADVVVCGAGVTALEVLYLGISSVMLPIASNQLPGAESLQQIEAAHVVSSGVEAASVAVDLFTSIGCFDTPALRGRSIVDGKGTGRIYRKIMQMAE